MSLYALALYYVIGILFIGSVVVIHELGHFVVAKIIGIEVEAFSLGFGPTIKGWKKGTTEFRISLFPFGGYCTLKGSDDLLRALDEKSNNFVHVENGSLFSSSPFARVLTYLAGPVTNILLALLLCTVLQVLPQKTLFFPPVVATVNTYPTLFPEKQTSPAYDAGIRTHDIILSMNGKRITQWTDATQYLQSQKDGHAEITVARGEEILSFSVQGEKNEDNSFRFGLTNIYEAKIASLRLFSPERKAGLLSGDTIIEINDAPIHNNLDLLQAFQAIEKAHKANAGTESITMKIKDADTGISKTIHYTPSFQEGIIQPHFSLYAPTRTTAGSSFNVGFKQGFDMTKRLFSTTIHSLYLMVTGKTNDVRNVITGPMRASYMVGNITVMGWENSILSAIRALCYVLSIVSISLAIANLIPLPLFDGGQILISFIEGITKRKMSPKLYWKVQLLGLVIIVAIFVFMYSIDVKYIITNGFNTLS